MDIFCLSMFSVVFRFMLYHNLAFCDYKQCTKMHFHLKIKSVLLLTWGIVHAVGLNAYIQDYEIWCQETRAIILWYSAKHLELLRCNSHLTDGGTDRWTDILVANAVLNYFMQPKVTEFISLSLHIC